MASEGVSEPISKTFIIAIVCILVLLLLLFVVGGWFLTIFHLK